MPAVPIEERLEELRRLVAERDLSRATRRMLDVCADADLPMSLRKPAIRLRAAYNAYSTQEQETSAEAQHEQLLREAVRLIGEIASHFSAQATAPAEAPPTPSAASNVGAEVVSCRGITKVFRTPRYTFELPELDLQLRLGEITGIVGENGSGKTTLLRIEAGELEASGGELRELLYDRLILERFDQ